MTVRYEGYGPGGAAVLVDCITQDREHTAGVLRRVFASYGGHLGAMDSVAYLFNEAGVLRFAPASADAALARVAMAAGAEDVLVERHMVLVVTDPRDLGRVRAALSAAGFEAGRAEVTQRPAVQVGLDGPAAQAMRSLLAGLKSVEDVQSIYTNACFADEFLAAV